MAARVSFVSVLAGFVTSTVTKMLPQQSCILSTLHIELFILSSLHIENLVFVALPIFALACKKVFMNKNPSKKYDLIWLIKDMKGKTVFLSGRSS